MGVNINYSPTFNVRQIIIVTFKSRFWQYRIVCTIGTIYAPKINSFLLHKKLLNLILDFGNLIGYNTSCEVAVSNKPRPIETTRFYKLTT